MNSPSRRISVLVVAIACASCATPDFGPRTDILLNVAFMKEQIGATAYPDVMSKSQCLDAQELSVKVIEERRGFRTLSSFGNIQMKYEDIAATVQRYFEEAMRESKIRVLPSGGTIVQVRVEELTMTTGWGPAAGSAILAVSIPQWNFSAKYLGEEVSGTIYRGIAYSVHTAVLKFLNDPQALSHLQCRASN